MGMLSPLSRFDPVVGLAAVAVLFTTVAQYLPLRRLELCSEIVCWAALPFMVKYAGPSNSHTSSSLLLDSSEKQQHWSSRSQWAVAAGITAAAFYRAESNAVGFFPILTPLLLAVHKYLQCQPLSSTPSSSFTLSLFSNNLSSTIFIAVPAVLSLSYGDPFGSLVSMILVGSLLFTYIILGPGLQTRIFSLPSVDVEAHINDISLRTISLLLVALVIQALVLGAPTSDILLVLLSGTTKAGSWYFTIQTIQHASWAVATTIGTFALACTRNPVAQSSEIQALSHVVVSILALGQTIHLLPQQARGKVFLWFLILASIFPYALDTWMINEAQSAARNAFSGSQVHPIEALEIEATNSFRSLVRNQSTTYPAAVDEYRRRYGLDPPPGFETWYNFAVQNHSPIIDEFDLIYDSISPFWKLSGEEYTKMISSLYNTTESELWLCKFSGKEARTKCYHPERFYDRHYSYLFDRLLWNFPGVLPDIAFLVNHFDEPRVLVPPQSSPQDGPANKTFHLTDISLRPTWDALTGFCKESSNTVQSTQSGHARTFGLPFVESHTSNSDLCKHPEYSTWHGSFISPQTFRLIEGLAPIMSTGVLSTMGDILIPSPAYIEAEFRYDSKHDMPWSQKKNNVYWTGSSTGSYALDDTWRHHQRQRFVNLAQNLGQEQHSYLREKDGVVSRIRSSFLNGRLFDVAFTRIFQCDSKYCRDQSTHFNVKSWADKDAAFGSKLVFDLDGNGISGRYYKLLASNSLPMKQTLFREWHDERLVPWVHYVPVSQSLEELPELVTYLTSTEAGKRIAEKMARRGKDWASRALREVDMTLYIYRLLLELARLQDPARKAI
ncbi:hypothetical protein F66182_3861 [Fusarium sp. NRRL 66182]|nr:hypothetical protein F66182_3861 [Fusarium sp. NRRL 66182]